MKYFFLADEYELLAGMRLVGIPGALAASGRQVEKALDAVCSDDEVAVLLVTRPCYELSKARLDALIASGGPPFVTILESGAESGGARALRERISELLGQSL